MVVVGVLNELIMRSWFSSAAASTEQTRRQLARSSAPSRSDCIAGRVRLRTAERALRTFDAPRGALRVNGALDPRPRLWPAHWTAISELHVSTDRSRVAATPDGRFITTLRSYVHDDDGDLVLPRRGAPLPPTPHHAPTAPAAASPDSDVIRLIHAGETDMESVGLQLWAGALVLSEFIMANEQHFANSVVLELGAGLALPSLCAARAGARRVFATDYADAVLANCTDNLALNAAFLRGAAPPTVRRLDWLQPAELLAPPAEATAGPWRWSREDCDAISGDVVILAADVVYDEVLTDGTRNASV